MTREECLSRDNAPTILASQPTRASRKRRASRPSRPSSFVLFVLDFLLVVERSGLCAHEGSGFGGAGDAFDHKRTRRAALRAISPGLMELEGDEEGE